MSEIQGSTAGRCFRCLRIMCCCYPRQTGSDDERRPLLNPIRSSNLNSNSQSNQDEHRSARNSVSHDRRESFSEESEERHARSIRQLNQICRESSVQIVCQESSSQTNSVKPINQGSQTSIVHAINWEIQNSLVQQVNQECQTSSFQLANQESQTCCDPQENPDSQTNSVQQGNQECQTSSVQLANEESQTCSDLQENPVQQVNQECQTSSVQLSNQESLKCSDQEENQDRQTSSVQEVNWERQNCSDQPQIKSFQTSLKEENGECQAASIIQECEQNTGKQYLKQNVPGELAILHNSIFMRSLECKYNLLDYLRQYGCLTGEVAAELQSHAYRTDRELNNALVDFINPANVDIFKQGLASSNQSHLVNYINKNGIRESPDDDDWPVIELDCDIIIKSYSELVEGLHTRNITDKLFANGCLSSVQMTAIRGKENTMEQNRELLYIAMRRSVRHLKIFLECLQKDHAEILSQSEDKDLFAVNLDDIYNLANTVDNIDKAKKEILRRAKERGFDARMIEDRLYFVTKTKVDKGMTAECSGSEPQSGSVAVGVKKLITEVIGNDVEITQLVNFDKHPDDKDAWLSSSTKVNIIIVNINRIAGVTVVDDEIFVVGEDQSHVNVYDSHSLAASRAINIPGMKSPQDLAGCSYNKALYIADNELNCIHKFEVNNNSVTRWKMKKNHLPRGLSMTNEHNVLVSVRADGEVKDYLVVEYTSDGQLVREIRLDIANAKRATYNHDHAYTVQLSSDQFVVCYVLGTFHSVCLINTEGQVIKSYDGERRGGGGRLSYPWSIAIDYNSKHIFVADLFNNRVLMLDTDLTYLGRVHTPSDHRRPFRLYFDSSTDRLIVSEGEKVRLLVISSSH